VKALPVLAALAGLAAMAGLVGYFGVGAVLHSLLAFGAGGFAAICLIHIVLIAAGGLAWRALVPGGRVLTFLWGRLVRDAGAEALPLSQVGGYVLGARAVTLAGVSGTVAAASTIVDIALEFVAQLAYTALGVALLIHLKPDTAAALPIMIGLAIAGIAAAAFFFLQRHGFSYSDRIARILGRGWAERSTSGAATLHAALAGIHRNPARLSANFLLHLACWIASALEAWIAVRFAGVAIGFGAVLVIESLLYAIRSVAFVIPNAVGVQEGAYILIGANFGLAPEMALALSLLKRARDLTIGLPAIASWQVLEGGRLWRRIGRRTTPIGLGEGDAEIS
jgi:putative membrane protein